MGLDMKGKGVKSYFSKREWYSYHRPTRTRIRAPWGTPAFDAELAEIELQRRRQTIFHLGSKSFFFAIQDFESSEDFRTLPLRKRSGYIAVIKWLSPKDAAIELAEITAPFARRLRDKAARSRGVRFGNTTLSFLQSAIAFYVANGRLATNCVASVPKLPLTTTRTTKRRTLSSQRTCVNRLTDSTCNRNFDDKGIGDFTRK